MKKFLFASFLIIMAVGIWIFADVFCFLFTGAPVLSDYPVINDITRLNHARPKEVIRVKDVETLQRVVIQAHQNHWKVAIAGARHSQGGHQFCDDCIVLDMRDFNKILSLDTASGVITVQSGVTWKQIQDYANPHGLAVKVMQASNIFTVGGSLGVNVHGNDPNYGTIIETVRALRLMRPDGSLVQLSRTENPELFSLAIGGFGLFGIIVEADLELTANDVYESQSIVMDYHDYPAYFEKNTEWNIGIHSAKLSIAPETLLKELVVTNYVKIPSEEVSKDVYVLQEEKDVLRNKLIFALSRKFDWGKSLRWKWQNQLIAKVGQKEIISRNNAMRPVVKILEYDCPKDTDILQEYFVPRKNFVPFVDGFREIVKARKINLLSVTVRYVPPDPEAFLPFAQKDSFALVIYVNQPLSGAGIEEAGDWTREIVDLALQLEGTFYLAYQQYPAPAQLQAGHPRLPAFLQKKKEYDPDEMFVSQFYGYLKSAAGEE